MFSLFDRYGQIHPGLFESLNEEQALHAFERIKERLIEIQKDKLAALEKEAPPLFETIRYKPRKRMPPKHVGYFVKREKDTNTNQYITTLFSRWSQGRPPRNFTGLTDSEWKTLQVSKEEFYQLLKNGLDDENYKIVKSQLGFDHEGRSMQDFLKHMDSLTLR